MAQNFTKLRHGVHSDNSTKFDTIKNFITENIFLISYYAI
ncbi:hypothetical protein PB1A_1088 [Leuconostoc inhae]|uniref:Uncharacterized protein n=2 Tax=Leuconostoc TaxID=1243 RepID=A0AAN2UH88_9LACO|nr:hypothetical protein LEGAS_1821 [Leuconostoc gasicomitatum LMG 18811]CUW06516.1 hypothetical protein KSL4_0664 [Leuconostoc inhae]CUW12987.1 hypothetical protein C122C_1723 [Leuconostoc gasicomitatum]CUW10175.1 hypothetical protein PB1A_1088 [Leuconostoc inhae]CUW15626.1 hypothetical protein C120C_1461 [Leuconostoc inhae]